MKWLLLVMVALTAGGCRTLHEERVSERLLGKQLMHHEFDLSLFQLDAKMRTAQVDERTVECLLCVTSSTPLPDGKQVYCMISGMHTGCVLAQESRGTRSRLVAIDRPLATPLARALWQFLEGPTAESIATASERAVDAYTRQEEDEFEGAWSFFASLGTSAVVSLDSPAIGFGAQGGFRRWLNYFLIGGAGLEVESVPFRAKPFTILGLQGRAELTMWDDRFRNSFNLPGVSFLMSITPLVAFGERPAFGARAMLGVQMLRLGNAWTPIRLEIGYQYVVVDGLSVAGARAGVMIGF